MQPRFCFVVNWHPRARAEDPLLVPTPSVMPAKAGTLVKLLQILTLPIVWIPTFVGMTAKSDQTSVHDANVAA